VLRWRDIWKHALVIAGQVRNRVILHVAGLGKTCTAGLGVPGAVRLAEGR
jgi:hypothetical protein